MLCFQLKEVVRRAQEHRAQEAYVANLMGIDTDDDQPVEPRVPSPPASVRTAAAASAQLNAALPPVKDDVDEEKANGYDDRTGFVVGDEVCEFVYFFLVVNACIQTPSADASPSASESEDLGEETPPPPQSAFGRLVTAAASFVGVSGPQTEDVCFFPLFSP